MSHLTEEASKRVWFINLPEEVEAVTPQDRIAELERENAALRKDKARLDWFLKLEEDDRVTFCRGWYRWTPEMVKAEIDAELRKEAQQ